MKDDLTETVYHKNDRIMILARKMDCSYYDVTSSQGPGTLSHVELHSLCSTGRKECLYKYQILYISLKILDIERSIPHGYVIFIYNF